MMLSKMSVWLRVGLLAAVVFGIFGVGCATLGKCVINSGTIKATSRNSFFRALS